MYLVFDVGGTKIRLGLVSESQKLVSSKIVETPKSADEGIKEIIQFVGEIRIYKVVGAVSGLFHKDKTKIFKSPNLPGWEDVNLKDKLEKAFGCEAFLENDAAMAGLGEAVFGAGKGFAVVAYMTISTGVGGSRIVNSKIDEKSYGFEPGSQVISLSSSQIKSTKSVIASEAKQSFFTLEDLIGGAAVKKMYKKDPGEIKDKNFWKNLLKYAAAGFSNVNVFWSPDVIVIGGGVASNDMFDLNVVRNEMEKLNRKYPKLPVLRKSTLGDFSGIYGGIVLLQTT